MENKNKIRKKAAILSVADLRHMTCANFFCEYFKRNKIDFDFICIQRYEKPAKTIYDCEMYQYKSILPTNIGSYKRMKVFYEFKKYADSVIKNNNYDLIVVWGENAAWLFNKTLKKHRNYCVNIRDFLEGKNKIFIPVLKNTLKHARFNTTPAPGGINYLGIEKLVMLNKDYQVLHNYKKTKRFTRSTGIIRITYMGIIPEYISTFKKILSIFKNDSRFVLAYYGKDAEVELKEYAEENGIHNVILGGAFSPDKTSELLEATDIINSVYGTENTGVETAIGVKESYGPLLHIPVLSDSGSYFSDLSEKYGFGKGVSIDDNMPDVVYNWYTGIVSQEFDFGCDQYCEWLEKINSKIEKELDKII